MKQETLERASALESQLARIDESLEEWGRVTSVCHLCKWWLQLCPEEAFERFRDECIADLERQRIANRAEFEAL